jgi:hypothetical protein
VLPPEDRREAAAVKVLPAVAAITPRAVFPVEAATAVDRALQARADTAHTTDGADTRAARATMAAATSLRVPMCVPAIADFTVAESIWVMAWVMALPMGILMIRDMPTLQVILTDRPPCRRPAPTAHTISMVPGSLIPTAIPAKANIRNPNRATVPINSNIHRSRLTVPINSSIHSNIHSRSRTTIPISLNGTIDNRIEAYDTRSGEAVHVSHGRPILVPSPAHPTMVRRAPRCRRPVGPRLPDRRAQTNRAPAG